MLIELTSTPHRLVPEQYKEALVLWMGYGDVHLNHHPEHPKGTPIRTKVQASYKEQGLSQVMSFRLLPDGRPSYENDDAIGWDFHIHETDRHNLIHSYYKVTLWRPPKAHVWTCRYRDFNLASSMLDIRLAGFDTTFDTQQLKDRTTWDRILEGDL